MRALKFAAKARTAETCSYKGFRSVSAALFFIIRVSLLPAGDGSAPAAPRRGPPRLARRRRRRPTEDACDCDNRPVGRGVREL
ncbi:hypothetical protein EVAR_102418_1 [Eumeta japonica]|uniref:Uncharacterized protein n=1 Tax=Eumeta variegata TaxID=151549 RepID=A0A4C1YWI5_EUMVA|nr:hypothetical protein EVAR_102418_1 [Eumeta japonica]